MDKIDINFSLSKSLDILQSKLTDWSEMFIAMLPNLIIAALIVVGFWLLARLTRSIVSKLFSRVSDNQSLKYIFKTSAYLIVLSIGIFTALTVVHLDKAVTSMLAGVGIIGLALGFAFQDIAANFVSGVLISIRKPYIVGDLIASQDKMGIVKSIDLRTTKIQDFQGQEVIIPNKEVFSDVLMNYTTHPKRRIDLECGVSYGDDLEQVQKITVKAIEGIESLDKSEDISFFFTSFGDSSINFSVRYWVNEIKQANWLQSRHEGVIAIKKAFDKNDIAIPFPIRTLDFGVKGGENLKSMINQKMQEK